MSEEHQNEDGTIRVSIMSLFSDIRTDVNKMNDAINKKLDTLSSEFKDNINGLAARTSRLESWQLTHENEGHAKLNATVAENTKKINEAASILSTEQENRNKRERTAKRRNEVYMAIFAFLTLIVLAAQFLVPLLSPHL